MDLWSNLASFSVLTTSTLLISILAGICLLLTKRPAGRYLGFLLISDSILLAAKVIGFEVLLNASFAQLTVAAYLYLRSFFYQKNRVSPIHFLVILSGWVVAPFSNDLISWIVVGLVMTCYVILCIRLLNEESNSRGFSYFFNPGDRIAWFRNFILLQVVTIISFFFSFDNWVYSIMILGQLGYVLNQLFNESSFLSPIPISNKYKKSTLAPGIKAAIVEKLEEIMLIQKFYRNDDASLTRLADLLSVTNHHLSQVLNDSLKISFQDLMARYRVREACQLLRDESNEQVKIENIATQVGYNSKSAFNTAFKRRTGLTPSEYRNKKNVLIYGEEHLSERREPQSTTSHLDLNHVFNFKIKRDMIQHFFKIFTRNVKRNGLFSFLNVLGLTVGFTCSILIYLFIQDELGYDKSLPDSDRIYRIAWMSDNPQTRVPHPMAQAMVADLPEVEEAVSISPWYGPGLSKDLIRVKNTKTNVIFEEPDFFFMDSTFFDVFKLNILEGDKDALKKPFSLV
ncbi:MAG: helix-turn-helix domain-containing protein, partial [Bacteroidota bacterium]